MGSEMCIRDRYKKNGFWKAVYCPKSIAPGLLKLQEERRMQQVDKIDLSLRLFREFISMVRDSNYPYRNRLLRILKRATDCLLQDLAEIKKNSENDVIAMVEFMRFCGWNERILKYLHLLE